MYLSYQKVTADSSVKDVDDLTIPDGCVGAEVMAADNDVRFTMDNTTTPSTSDGMILLKGDSPKDFLIEDLRRIKFTRGVAADAYLLLHYFG